MSKHTDCGCKFYAEPGASKGIIKYCPRHAAAPELLEACKKAENEVENAVIGLTTDPLAYASAIKQRLESVRIEVQAAIAKATGESEDK